MDNLHINAPQPQIPINTPMLTATPTPFDQLQTRIHELEALNANIQQNFDQRLQVRKQELEGRYEA